ncbi:MAG: cytochrome P460 family protein [Phycisphaerales bacterium]
MRTVLITVICAALTGCAMSGDAPSPPHAALRPPEARQVADTYRSLRPMTPEPVLVDQHLAMLCRGVTADELHKARAVSGPHALAAIRVYMNDAAAGTFGQPGATYPVGSVIVKEKVSFHPASGRDGIGGMIKRASGYDPAHGDWEYFYREDSGSLECGRIDSCIQCHSSAVASDFVFGGWAGKNAPVAAPRAKPAPSRPGS